MKKKMVAVTLAGLLAVSATACGGTGEVSVDEQKVVNSESESTLDYSLNGYSFSVPDTWEEGDSNDSTFYFYPDTGMLMVQFSQIEGEDIMDSAVQKEFTQGLSQSYENFELTNESTVQVMNEDAYQQIINLTNNETNYQSTMVTFNCSGGWMSFALFEPEGSEGAYSEDFTAILNSVKAESSAISEEESNLEDVDAVFDQVQVEAVQTLDGLMCLFITNNSQTIIDELSVQINYKSDDNTTIDMDEDGFDMVLPGYTVVSRMDAPEAFSDYTIEASIELGSNPTYQNHSNDMQVNSNQGDQCIIVELTNNSDVSIDETEYIAVLYQGDQVATVEYPEDIMDIAPGDTVTEKIDTYGEEYDHFEIYLNQAHTFGLDTYSTEDSEESNSANTSTDANIPLGQQNALSSALDYLDFSSFSYTGLIEQLEYEGYTNEEATYAADNCGADWNEQAAKTAQDYLDSSSFSRQGLIDQLMYEGFTSDQAEYGVTAVGY